MTMGTEVAKRGDKELALYELETQFALAVRQRELLEKYIKERLKPEKHFYTVGDDPARKPSLTKEGAELICLPHGLKAHYQWVTGCDNPPLDDTPYQITMKCELESNGEFKGEGVGSASSMITKKTGERVQRQKDPGLRHNASIKMACKSAYIAATLNSTAASEFFTQDLEDDSSGGEGEPNSGAKTPTKEHWCSGHNCAFKEFTKGDNHWYSHAIKGTKPTKWCNEPKKEAPVEPPNEPQPPPQLAGQQLGASSQPAGQNISTSQVFKSWGELATAANKLGVSRTDICTKAGVKEFSEFADYRDAWNWVESIVADKEAAKR